jgi:hypothetical protein
MHCPLDPCLRPLFVYFFASCFFLYITMFVNWLTFLVTGCMQACRQEFVQSLLKNDDVLFSAADDTRQVATAV